jgi:XRE family transcriptional regulator, regulator of sulfur utilization
MKFTRRDGLVALVAAALTAGGFAVAQQAEVVGKSWAIDWSSIPAKTTNVGTLRTFFKGPTATLADLDVHVTTLNPGAASHQPHKHPNEEMLIIKEGQATVLINGEWKTVGPGSVVYLASNVPHAARNDSAAPVTYTVVNFRIPGAPDVKPVFVNP